jgi:hypothetical protein
VSQLSLKETPTVAIPDYRRESIIATAKEDATSVLESFKQVMDLTYDPVVIEKTTKRTNNLSIAEVQESFAFYREQLMAEVRQQVLDYKPPA